MERKAFPAGPRCPDCVQCQMCSRSRCRACQKGGHLTASPQPGVGLTHGAYLEWKAERDRRRAMDKEFAHEGVAR